MALTWDTSGIENRKSVTTITDIHGNEAFSPITNALIWMMMLCGIGQITEATVGMAVERIGAWQAAFGPQINFGGDIKIHITEADVRAHVGLRTNADRWSAPKWRNNLAKMIERDGARIMAGSPGKDFLQRVINDWRESHGSAMELAKKVIDDEIRSRKRTPEQDADEYPEGALLNAASVYRRAWTPQASALDENGVPVDWPLAKEAWVPGPRIICLAKAGAYCAAEAARNAHAGDSTELAKEVQADCLTLLVEQLKQQQGEA